MRAGLGIVVLVSACRFGFDRQPGADVPDATDVVDVAPSCGFVLGAGRQHLSAVFPDGSARVWGYGAYGQIGDGMMVDRYVPTPVALPASVVSVAAGRYETCAALTTGEAYCWGEGDSGQLGDGAGATRATPSVPVANLTTVVEVAAAAVHACARTQNGDVWCWGEGGSGRLGRGSTMSSLVPVRATVSGAKRLMAGGSTSCVILDDDSPRCWGYNQQGGVGINSTVDAPTPVQPMGLAKVRAIIPRDVSACAVRGDGNVLCWGGNAQGQTGTGTTGGDLLVPTQTVTQTGPLVGALDVGLGIHHGCALLENGEVWCWGRNELGQLGNGVAAAVNQPYATRVIGLPAITHIGVAAWTTCGLDGDGSVWCWGMGTDGELGDGTQTANQPTPQPSFVACE